MNAPRAEHRMIVCVSAQERVLLRGQDRLPHLLFPPPHEGAAARPRAPLLTSACRARRGSTKTGWLRCSSRTSGPSVRPCRCLSSTPHAPGLPDVQVEKASRISVRWLTEAVSSLVRSRGKVHSGADVARHCPAPRCAVRPHSTPAAPNSASARRLLAEPLKRNPKYNMTVTVASSLSILDTKSKHVQCGGAEGWLAPHRGRAGKRARRASLPVDAKHHCCTEQRRLRAMMSLCSVGMRARWILTFLNV